MRFSLSIAVLVAVLAASAPASQPRVIYSNDATNIASTPPPCAVAGTVPERLGATIDEAAATDVHMLQPGNGWVPWWRSEQYPADEHYRWFQKIAGREPDLIGRFMRDGGDLVAEFITSCRSRGVSPFLSLRLNDYHGSESWDVLREFIQGRHRDASLPLGLGAMAAQSRPLLDNPGYQLRPDPQTYLDLTWEQKLSYAADPPTRISLRTARVWDWSRPEVPAYKLGFVRELCAGYDIDGFELDFMRWSAFFRPTETTSDQRRKIMLGFIREVRAALDSMAHLGRRRTLGVRVPSRLSGHEPLGIDLPAWVEAGVDWVNLSCHYISEQQTDLATIHRMIPDTPVYLELTFASAGWQGPSRVVLDDTKELGGHRLMTPEQFYTAAHLAYARGATGVSLFNFVYYRNLGVKPQVPPFDVLERLKDRSWLAQQPQHYFLSVSGNPPSAPSEFSVQRRVRPGKSALLHLDMAPPEKGWLDNARLRLEATQPWPKADVQVRFNGNLLAADTDISHPYPSAYAASVSPCKLKAWIVPRALLKDGMNRLELTVSGSEDVELRFIDIAVR
jgi:hypothetical protein